MLKELVEYDAPDVLLVQEVDAALYSGQVRAALERLGYDVELAKELQHWHSVALAWRRERFRLVASCAFTLNELVDRALRRWLTAQARGESRGILLYVYCE